ncbi:MAG: hypothetical protein L3J52_01395 [Proteobacteria bacterium]|nr:hypothetical protein [Pseudomonadota bacterium]
MLTSSPEHHQTNIFGTDILQQLDQTDPLLQLSATIPWLNFHTAFKPLYKYGGAPSKPICLMVRLLILKQLNNLATVLKLVKFRSRIGKAGVEKIFQMSIKLHGSYAQETVVNIDTTVQEKKAGIFFHASPYGCGYHG